VGRTATRSGVAGKPDRVDLYAAQRPFFDLPDLPDPLDLPDPPELPDLPDPLDLPDPPELPDLPEPLGLPGPPGLLAARVQRGPSQAPGGR
jgi:hypothetical protein